MTILAYYVILRNQRFNKNSAMTSNLKKIIKKIRQLPPWPPYGLN